MSCKYAEVGCEERPLRKDLKSHEEDDQLHLRITTEGFLKLRAEVTALKTMLSRAIPFAFKMTSFNQYKRKDKPFYSPPFYTSHIGYQMCVKVYANGHDDGTQVSVFAFLMKGDNDDYLSWPFTGAVSIELLNQLEDKNHHKKTITFLADDEASQRVVNGERGIGWGLHWFISHTDLYHQPAINRRYLMDNSLTFRVTVQVANYKP